MSDKGTYVQYVNMLFVPGVSISVQKWNILNSPVVPLFVRVTVFWETSNVGSFSCSHTVIFLTNIYKRGKRGRKEAHCSLE